MNSSGLFTELKKHPWILALVLVAHLILAILLGMNLSDKSPVMPTAKQHKIISAVVVDGANIDLKKQEKKKT